MIRGIGGEMPSTYSQTLNGWELVVAYVELRDWIEVISGPFLVSRTGDAGCSERLVKVPEYSLMKIPQKVLVHFDSRTVAMEVGTR